MFEILTFAEAKIKNMSKKRVTKKSTINPTKSKVVKPNLKDQAIKNDAPSDSSSSDLLFNRTNYMYIAGGILLMMIGFFLMSGGSMPDPNTWDESIIYSTRRTLIAPIFILSGLVVQVLAIFKKSN